MTALPAALPTPPATPRKARQKRETRVWPERWLAVGATGPVALDVARAALPRQAALDAPVKLALAAGGKVELRAELPRARGCDAAALVHRALERGWAWLEGAEPQPEAGAPADAESLEAALRELPDSFAWEPAEGADADGAAHYRVHATAFGSSTRLSVEARPGTTRISVRSAVPAGEAGVAEALVYFALEVNRRLRLARLSVTPAGGGPRDAALVTWDAPLPAALPLERALPAAVQAVLGAQAATRPALRALAHAEVARVYRATRPQLAGGSRG